jgi:hypothetical protein
VYGKTMIFVHLWYKLLTCPTKKFDRPPPLLQYDRAPLRIPFKLTLPIKKIVLPLPMHVVYAAQYPRKPLLSLIDKRREVSFVFGPLK